MHFFKSALSLAILAGSALAQTTNVLLPTPGSILTVGGNFTVEIDMTNSLSNVDVVATVIGLMQCNQECFPPTDFLGDLLYQGRYAYQLDNQYYAENFTVTVPDYFPPGNASLNVINFFMVGASYIPIVQYFNTSVVVVAA